MTPLYGTAAVLTKFGRVTTTVGVCDSCGRQEDDLAAVHRVYVVPESWDTAGSVSVEDGVERWCFPCRTHYPHQPLHQAAPAPPEDAQPDG